MASGINPIANLLGKVNSNGALVVALDGGAAAASLVTVTSDALGTTSTDGVVIKNTTDAAAGAQQISPRLRLTGEGWKTNATAASQVVDWVIENLPVEGAANPTSTLLFKSSINGAAYDTRFSLASGGDLTFGGSIIMGGSLQTVTAFEGTAASYLRFSGRLDGMSAPAASQINFSHSSAGFGFDIATDAIAKVRTRAQTGYATVDALAYRASGTQVVSTQGAAVADASGGAIIDAEARSALNALLARLRTHGLIAT